MTMIIQGVTYSERTTLHYSTTLPEDCTVNSETDRVLSLTIDRSRAGEAAKLLRAIVNSLEKRALEDAP